MVAYHRSDLLNLTGSSGRRRRVFIDNADFLDLKLFVNKQQLIMIIQFTADLWEFTKYIGKNPHRESD